MTDEPGPALWQPTPGKNGRMGAPVSGQRRVRAMNVMALADLDRVTRHAVISFPYEKTYYVVEDAAQLRAIIGKLQAIHDAIAAKGEGRVVSFL